MRSPAAPRWTLLIALLGSCSSQAPSDDSSLGPTVSDGPALLHFEHGYMPDGSYNGGVRSIFEDRFGNFWFGSWMAGVARFDGESLTYFTEEDGLSDNQVRTISEDRNGIIWFETGNGVSSFDGEKVLTHTIKDYSSKHAWRLDPRDSWFKTDGSSGVNELEGEPGVYRYDGETFTYLTFPLPEDRKSDVAYSVTGTSKGAGGRLWFATYAAVIGYDGKSFSMIDNKSLGLVTPENSDVGGVHIRSVLEDSKGNLWIGNNGIGVLLHAGDTTINFSEEHGVGRSAAGKGSPTLDRVFSIGEDSAGNIWFGTVEYGAWRYDGELLRNFTEADGLTSKGIMAIYTDRRGDLWLAGDGVFKLNGESFVRMH